MAHNSRPVNDKDSSRTDVEIAGEPVEVTFELVGNMLIPHMTDMATGEKKDYVPYMKPDGAETRAYCKAVAEGIERNLGRPVRYVVPKQRLEESGSLQKRGVQNAKSHLTTTRINVVGIIVITLLLLVLGAIKAREQYVANQKSLYASIKYEQAQSLYREDLGQYGQNDQTQAYKAAVDKLFAIEKKYQGGKPIQQAEIDATKQRVDKARNAYVDAAKKKLKEEERTKVVAEEEKRRKEREEQERAERQAAKEAEEQRKREEAEANYTDPDYLNLPVCGDQLSSAIRQAIDDIGLYYGKVGWTDYYEKYELYAQYADAYEYSHGWTHDHKNPGSGVFQVSEEDVLVALEALAQARRHMVVEQTVNPDLLDESMDYDPNDPFVYVTETGHKFHSKENCRGLNNANETYVVKRSEVKAEGFSECKICY